MKREKMKTRLKDIADRLNISTALVSGVLNNRGNVWASEETRTRIFAAARDLNYDGGSKAPSKKVASQESVLLVVGHSDSAELVARCLAERLVLTVSIQSDAKAAIQWSSTRTSSATFLMGNDARMQSVVQALGNSCVVIGREDLDGVVQVTLDEEKMATGALDHLRSLGHRKIALVGEPSFEFRRAFEEWHDVCFHSVPTSEQYLRASFDSVSAAMRRPESTRPTGWIVVGGSDAWSILQVVLAQNGFQLGFGGQDHAACGPFDRHSVLVSGRALVFDLNEAFQELAIRVLSAEVRNSGSDLIRIAPRLCLKSSGESSGGVGQ